jgi:Protein of unknown function (DUF3800)
MTNRFYLYIDDSGTRFPDRKPLIQRSDGIDCFALGGILIEDKDRAALQVAHDAFCARWGITAPLHSTKIRGLRDAFAWLGESPKTKKDFLNDLDAMLLHMPVVGFATVVDRHGYNIRYKEKYGDQRWWMCKTAYNILIERVCKHVDAQRGTLTIRFEETGKKEDRAIIGYAKDMKRDGAPFDPSNSRQYGALGPADYKRIIEGEPRRVTKKDSPAVQIADLYLYPMLKAGYDPTYEPWLAMFNAKKVIDALLPEAQRPLLGIKYSCFEMNQKSERPSSR